MSMKSLLFFFLIFPAIIFSQKEKNKSKKNFFIHHIEESDTYHSLKLKYGISKRKIIKWNPELKKCKFLSDCSEILKIKISINEKNQFIFSSLEDSLLVTDSIDSVEVFFDDLDSLYFVEEPMVDTLIFQKKDSIINVAVFLPFFSNKTDSLISNTSLKKLNHKKFPRKSRISLDFYSGLLFSFQEFFSDSTLELNLSVFDTYHNVDTIKTILKNTDLNSMDLIFGPLYQKNFDFLLNYIDSSNVVVVSPLQANSVNTNYFNNSNVYFFEADADKKVIYTSNYIFNRYLKDIHSSTNVSVFLKEEEKKEKELVSNFLKDWKDNVAYYEIEKSTISEEMTDQEINSISGVVFLPSKDPVFVTDILSRLHALKDTSMVVFCNEDVLDLNVIPHSELYDLNVHFFSEKKPLFKSKNFIKSFYQYFSTDPQSRYVQQGYKCGLYFLNLFFGDYISSDQNSILGTYYKFILQENNIYRNEAWKLWKYEKYNIKEVLDVNESQ